MHTVLSINISVPSRSRWDEVIPIRIEGATPGEPIELSLHTTDEQGVIWESSAVFVADELGIIHLAKAKPIRGTYEEAHPMGLFWSMTSRSSTASFSKRTVQPCQYTLCVSSQGTIIHRQQLERTLLSDDIVRTEIEDEFIGTYFCPNGARKVPAVLVLGGSDGGLDESLACLLAHHGYAVLVVAYFRHKHLPDKLINIPLEYFRHALTWLKQQPNVQTEKVGVFGRSKGGELALLLASQFPDIHFAISHVGGGVVFQGIGNHGRRPTSSWSIEGTPIPFSPFSFSHPKSWWSLLKPKLTGQLPSFLTIYEKTLHRMKPDHQAIIPVEKIRGPILLTSGTDDAVWPATYMNEQITQRLQDYGFQYPYRHVRLPEAGHHIMPPFFPTTARQSKNIAYGGNTVADASASEMFWKELLAFLSDFDHGNMTAWKSSS